MTLEGVDVSVHNGLWAGPPPDFAIVRACYGLSKDSKYDLHVARFKSLGVITGAYAFGRYASGSTQAKALLTWAKNAAFIALDQEADGAFNPAMTDEQAKAFIDECHRQNKKVGLYHSLSGYPKSLGQDWNWVAKWTAGKPAIKFDIWQYQGSPLDRNRFYGTKAQLVALGAPYLKPPPTDTKPPVPPPGPTRPYDGMPVLPTDNIEALHAAGYWMKGGKWVKTQPPNPPSPPPAGDRNGTPVLPTDDIEKMHAAGYWMLGGKWVRGDAAPAPVPPAPTPTSAFPPINTVASPRVAVSDPYPWVPFSSTTVAGLPAWSIYGKGATYLWVHGGPYMQAAGGHEMELLAFAQRVASKGGHRHYGIDYNSGWNEAHTTTDWSKSVDDVVAAAKALKAEFPEDPLVIVAHSWGGALCTIAVLRAGVGDAYAPINAVLSLSAISTITSAGMPDPYALAANRPSLPVAVITGSADATGAQGRQGFVDALAKAGHPGIYTVDTGDHTGTLGSAETANTLIKLLDLI